MAGWKSSDEQEPLISRRSILADLKSLFEDPSVRRIELVGRSGAGKSSIFKWLEREQQKKHNQSPLSSAAIFVDLKRMTGELRFAQFCRFVCAQPNTPTLKKTSWLLEEAALEQPRQGADRRHRRRFLTRTWLTGIVIVLSFIWMLTRLFGGDLSAADLIPAAATGGLAIGLSGFFWLSETLSRRRFKQLMSTHGSLRYALVDVLAKDIEAMSGAGRPPVDLVLDTTEGLYAELIEDNDSISLMLDRLLRNAPSLRIVEFRQSNIERQPKAVEDDYGPASDVADETSQNFEAHTVEVTDFTYDEIELLAEAMLEPVGQRIEAQSISISECVRHVFGKEQGNLANLSFARHPVFVSLTLKALGAHIEIGGLVADFEAPLDNKNECVDRMLSYLLPEYTNQPAVRYSAAVMPELHERHLQSIAKTLKAEPSGIGRGLWMFRSRRRRQAAPFSPHPSIAEAVFDLLKTNSDLAIEVAIGTLSAIRDEFPDGRSTPSRRDDRWIASRHFLNRIADILVMFSNAVHGNETFRDPIELSIFSKIPIIASRNKHSLQYNSVIRIAESTKALARSWYAPFMNMSKSQFLLVVSLGQEALLGQEKQGARNSKASLLQSVSFDESAYTENFSNTGSSVLVPALRNRIHINLLRAELNQAGLKNIEHRFETWLTLLKEIEVLRSRISLDPKTLHREDAGSFQSFILGVLSEAISYPRHQPGFAAAHAEFERLLRSELGFMYAQATSIHDRINSRRRGASTSELGEVVEAYRSFLVAASLLGKVPGAETFEFGHNGAAITSASTGIKQAFEAIQALTEDRPELTGLLYSDGSYAMALRRYARSKALPTLQANSTTKRTLEILLAEQGDSVSDRSRLDLSVALLKFLDADSKRAQFIDSDGIVPYALTNYTHLSKADAFEITKSIRRFLRFQSRPTLDQIDFFCGPFIGHLKRTLSSPETAAYLLDILSEFYPLYCIHLTASRNTKVSNWVDSLSAFIGNADHKYSSVLSKLEMLSVLFELVRKARISFGDTSKSADVVDHFRDIRRGLRHGGRPERLALSQFMLQYAFECSARSILLDTPKLVDVIVTEIAPDNFSDCGRALIPLIEELEDYGNSPKLWPRTRKKLKVIFALLNDSHRSFGLRRALFIHVELLGHTFIEAESIQKRERISYLLKYYSTNFLRLALNSQHDEQETTFSRLQDRVFSRYCGAVCFSIFGDGERKLEHFFSRAPSKILDDLDERNRPSINQPNFFISALAVAFHLQKKAGALDIQNKFWVHRLMSQSKQSEDHIFHCSTGTKSETRLIPTGLLPLTFDQLNDGGDTPHYFIARRSGERSTQVLPHYLDTALKWLFPISPFSSEPDPRLRVVQVTFPNDVDEKPVLDRNGMNRAALHVDPEIYSLATRDGGFIARNLGAALGIRHLVFVRHLTRMPGDVDIIQLREFVRLTSRDFVASDWSGGTLKLNRWSNGSAAKREYPDRFWPNLLDAYTGQPTRLFVEGEEFNSNREQKTEPPS